MRYIDETELRQLAVTGLSLRRQNWLWVCDQGAVTLPIHFAFMANEIKLRYDGSWSAAFSFAENEEFVVTSVSYSSLRGALYDIGIIVAALVEDTHAAQVIDKPGWEVVHEVVAFIAANADNNEPIPARLIAAIQEQETPALYNTLHKVQVWRTEVE